MLFAPFVLAAGPGRAFELLVRYPMVDFGDYQSLPFPLDYDGPLNTGVDRRLPVGLGREPAALLPAARARGRARRRARGGRPALPARASGGRWRSAVFALGMLHYLLARADAFHTAPLAVMVAVLAAWALAGPP